MNEEMRKKLAEINATKAEVRQLIADGKLDEAESKKAELDALQRAFNLLLSMEDEDEAAAKAQAKKKQELHDEEQPLLTFARIGQAVVNALGAAVSRRKMDDADRQIIQDAMKENSDPDGGLTVPQDIQTRIKELRRSDDNLEQYVNVEPVKTMSGSRVIEKEADTTAWPEIDENGEFTEVDTPQFAKIAYKITKKGGKMLCSLELLETVIAGSSMTLKMSFKLSRSVTATSLPVVILSTHAKILALRVARVFLAIHFIRYARMFSAVSASSSREHSILPPFLVIL